MDRVNRNLISIAMFVVFAVLAVGSTEKNNDNKVAIPPQYTLMYNVGNSNANIRFAPTTEATIVGKLQPNQPIKVIESKDGWSKVIYGETDASHAYIYADLLGNGKNIEYEIAMKKEKKLDRNLQIKQEEKTRLEREKEQEEEEIARKQREQERIAAQKRYDDQCPTNLQCWGEKFKHEAEAYCPSRIERLASYDVRWTDSFYQRKMSAWRWKDKEKGTLTYVGDKVQFQNGFGAWQNINYECDLDPTKNKYVIDVRVFSGKR